VQSLASATAVIAEVSFCEMYADQPQFGEVACFMFQNGFRVAGFGYNTPVEPPLVQADALFLRIPR
jgi:hypothetical protein